MNDDLPEPMQRLTPRPAPAPLRRRVLDAVSQELNQRRGPRWERIVQWSVAASLALGVGLNVWQQQTDQAWQLRVFGPLPVSRDIVEFAQAVESVTDAQTGQSVRQQLTDSRAAARGANPSRHQQYERLMKNLTDFRIDEAL